MNNKDHGREETDPFSFFPAQGIFRSRADIGYSTLSEHLDEAKSVVGSLHCLFLNPG